MDLFTLAGHWGLGRGETVQTRWPRCPSFERMGTEIFQRSRNGFLTATRIGRLKSPATMLSGSRNPSQAFSLLRQVIGLVLGSMCHLPHRSTTSYSPISLGGVRLR